MAGAVQDASDLGTPWSAEEQVRLEEGLRTFADVQETRQKWRSIATVVQTRGPKECALRYKAIRESVRGEALLDVPAASGRTRAQDVGGKSAEARLPQADGLPATATDASDVKSEPRRGDPERRHPTQTEESHEDTEAVDQRARRRPAPQSEEAREDVDAGERRAGRGAGSRTAKGRGELRDQRREPRREARESTDAAREPNDAMLEPTDAAREPTDAAREPTDAAQELTDAARELTDAAREPIDAAHAPVDAAVELTDEAVESTSGSATAKRSKGERRNRKGEKTGGKGERRGENCESNNSAWASSGWKWGSKAWTRDSSGWTWDSRGGTWDSTEGLWESRGGTWESRGATWNSTGEDRDMRGGKGERRGASGTSTDPGAERGSASDNWRETSPHPDAEEAEPVERGVKWEDEERPQDAEEEGAKTGEDAAMVEAERHGEEDGATKGGKRGRKGHRKGDVEKDNSGQRSERGQKGQKGERGKGARKGDGKGKSAKASRRDGAARLTEAREAARERAREEAGSEDGVQLDMSPLVRDTSTSLRDKLAQQLRRGNYECMVCMGKVGRQAFIWSCRSCSAMFHLKCAHQWIKKSNEGSRESGFTWPCPGCRYIHVEPRLPEYTCFCARILEPEASPHYTPHTCGEACDRKREGCPHPCPELCHPGPCPPCNVLGGPGGCYCGREKRASTRCGDALSWSCGEVCGRPLACGTHTCPLRCHAGRCPPCAVTEELECHCGAQVAQRPCGGGPFSCGSVCGATLSCGYHQCERLCHDGLCGECRFAPARWGARCACGKTDCSSEAAAAMLVRYAPKRSSCADRLSLCGSICGRRSLSGCGHACARPCHDGPCGPCTVQVEQRCRCERSDRRVECHMATTEESGVYLCKNPCRTKKSCSKHKCDVLCCPARDTREHEVHMCLLVCGRPLSCGTHTCEEFCHLGLCQPCRVVLRTPLTCACGAESIEPPVRCGTAPPECSRRCGQELECGHVCAVLCHRGDHPACTVPVAKLCVGGHTTLPPSPCHVPPGTCGRPCGRAMPGCGHHCRKACHVGDCPDCEEPCGARRLHCEHTCAALCHPGGECPDTPCNAAVTVSCKCGTRVERAVCGAHSSRRNRILPNLDCGPGCRGLQASGLSREDAGRETCYFDEDLLQVAERAGLQYVRFLEQKFDEVLPPARAGATAAIGLSRADLSSHRRLLVVELARVHYGLQHSSAPDPEREGCMTVSVWAARGSGSGGAAPSTRRPPGVLSATLAGGAQSSSICRRFRSGAPSVVVASTVRVEEALLEELCYELFAEDAPWSFRIRAEASGKLSARFASAPAAAAAFHRLTRQAASVEPQELRRVPPEPKVARLLKLAGRPRVSLVGAGAAGALGALRATAGASTSTGTRAAPSVWGRGPPGGGALPVGPAPAPVAVTPPPAPPPSTAVVAATGPAAAPVVDEDQEVPDSWED